jgi:hypothetical protein
MKQSVTWRYLLATGVRLMAVIAMTGFVAWLPSTRTGVSVSSPTVTVQVSWGGGAE